MKLRNDGLELWYGTPDAPAPGDEGAVPRRGNSVIVGVRPVNPSNTVAVSYRVDGGAVRTIPGREVRIDHNHDSQYFSAAFPPFTTGRVVEYAPVLNCSGRQVPSPEIANRFPSKFVLAALDRGAGAATATETTPATPGHKDRRRFAADLDFVATVTVDFESPQYVCDTAAGMRVNFFVREGTLEGDGFSGRVIRASADHLIVRPDGMANIRILAVFALDDGVLVDVEAGGYVDFGTDGYAKALAHRLPDRAPIAVTPLITTRHPKYRWLSRVQCIGVGYTALDSGRASYHVFAASARRVQ